MTARPTREEWSMENRTVINIFRETENGFWVNPGLTPRMVIESERARDCLEEATRLGIQGAQFAAASGFHDDSLECLRWARDLKSVSISGLPKLSLCGLECVSDSLQELRLSDSARDLDLGALESLRELTIQGSLKVDLQPVAKRLKRLEISGLNTKTRTFVEMPRFHQLEHVEINRTNLTSFAGIDRLGSVREFQISLASRLRDLTPILDSAAAESLERLGLANCGNAEFEEVVPALSGLKELQLIDCGEIESLSFLDQMPNLEVAVFGRTIVKDGCLKPLLRMNYAYIQNRRHYSHSLAEVEAAIEKRMSN